MSVNIRIGSAPKRRRRAKPTLTKVIVALVLGLAALAVKVYKDKEKEKAAAPPATAAAPQLPESFAGMQITPHPDWKKDRGSAEELVFQHALRYGTLRLRVVPQAEAADHAALVRSVVPDAQPARTPLPDFAGAGGLSFSRAADQRVLASWLVTRADKTVQVLFWGEPDRVADIPLFKVSP